MQRLIALAVLAAVLALVWAMVTTAPARPATPEERMAQLTVGELAQIGRSSLACDQGDKAACALVDAIIARVS